MLFSYNTDRNPDWKGSKKKTLQPKQAGYYQAAKTNLRLKTNPACSTANCSSSSVHLRQTWGGGGLIHLYARIQLIHLNTVMSGRGLIVFPMHAAVVCP